MKKHSMPAVHEAHPNVTPLIDVVMCLIIFFMLVAKIGITTGADNDIKIPSAFYGTDIKDRGNTFYLNVFKSNSDEPLVEAIGTNGTMQKLPIQDGNGGFPLRNVLKYFKQGDPARGIEKNDNLKVIIRGDREVLFNTLSPVLSECANAQIKSIAFETSQGEQPTDQTP